MIIRRYAACAECETAHVLRIGIGGEPVQAHHFACRQCGSEMGVRLEMGVGFSFGPNTVEIDQNDDAPTVNVHSSFVFAKQEIDSADAFPSLSIGRDMFHAILEERAKRGLPADLQATGEDQPRRARITEEWEPLRAAWSLTRHGKGDLAMKRLEKFVPGAGYADPPETISDWLFQFVAGLGQPHHENLFDGLFEVVKTLADKEEFSRFVLHYGDRMSEPHARRYFEACKSYLSRFTEFSQVHALVAANVAVGEDHAAASSDFDSTRMIYGELFEAFGDNVEILVALNNMSEGRPFDRLRTMSLEEYRSTDKAGRCRAIAENPLLAAICAEFDNKVRNASHHGGMAFDRAKGTIDYAAGKGGKGEIMTMGYAAYLAKCARLFIQLTLLFRLERFIANQFGARLPI